MRRTLFALGYRYRLHVRDLPGSPDIVFSRRRKAIFVHGCFWHGHGCSRDRRPSTKTEYWIAKLAANKRRDAANLADLDALGWKTLVLWECDLSNPRLPELMADFLGDVTHSV